jgi:hypothetical protein
MNYNYAYWSWLPLASASSAQTIGQSQCIFVFIFSVVVLNEPPSCVRLLLVLLCVVGVGVLTLGDSAANVGAGSAGSSSRTQHKARHDRTAADAHRRRLVSWCRPLPCALRHLGGLASLSWVRTSCWVMGEWTTFIVRHSE